jgi:hypothetical protein
MYVTLPESQAEHAKQWCLSVTRIGVTHPLFEEVRKLRASAYCMPFDQTRDPIDEYSHIWLAFQDGDPVGSIRVTYAREGKLDCEERFPTALVRRFRPQLSSASRFCSWKQAPPELRIARFLIETAWHYALLEGIRTDIIDVNERAIRYYERLGYYLVPNSFFRHPLLDTPSHVMVFAADPGQTSPLQHLFCGVPNTLRLSDLKAWLPTEHTDLDAFAASYSEQRQQTAAVAQPNPPRPLQPGSILSYSAGQTSLDPNRFRVVLPKPGKLEYLLQQFPRLAAPLALGTPLVINAYPAPLTALRSCVVVDSYCRSETIARAMLLAVEQSLPCILIGQPLFLTDFLLRHIKKAKPLPERLVVCLGGYTCPRSLERLLLDLMAKAGVHFHLVHLYGVAEIDAGLMAAMDRTMGGDLIYRPIDEEFAPVVRDEHLWFAPRKTPECNPIPTDELAEPCEDGLVIWNPSRLGPIVAWELETWKDADWLRRTGFVGNAGDNLLLQLREGEEPRTDKELPFYKFAEQFGMSWLQKPDWR